MSNALVPAAEIRAWAHGEGLDCPTTGKIPKRITDAYYEAFPASDTPQPSGLQVDISDPDDEGMVVVTVTVTGGEQWEAAIGRGLADAIACAFQAGREAERAAIVAHLTTEVTE